MVYGFDVPRPTARQYDAFVKDFSDGLRKLNIEGLSLLLYGSFVRKDLTPGRSDIDGVLIFDDYVVIDKTELGKVAVVLSEALKRNAVPLQISVSDLKTMRDGRFSTFDPSFDAYFRDDKETKIVVGPDYRGHFNHVMPSVPTQERTGFNLRKGRNGLLNSRRLRETDKVKFVDAFQKSLDGVASSAKHILYMGDGRLRVKKFSTISEIGSRYPKVNTEPLKRIGHLFANTPQLDVLYTKPDEALVLWNNSVTFLEELIREHIIANPQERKE